jgi:hypothetical protein
MVALLGRGSIPRDELIEAVSNDTRLGSRAAITKVAERLLQIDMAFAQVDDAVCYTPQLVDGTRWTMPVGADDVDRGFVPMHPAWSPLGWWLVTAGADLVDTNGDTIGRIETEGKWLSDDEPDVDVVVGPPGWLDAAVGGWMTVGVQSEQLQVTGCPTPPAATPRQIAAVQAGFERSVSVVDAELSDGAYAELATSGAAQVLQAALLVDRDAFVDAPVPYLPDLLEAAGLEHRRETVAPAGFDWSALEERRRRNRHRFLYGLGEREVDALTLLSGAFGAFSADGDSALGATEDERDNAAILLAALAELDGVAEAFLAEAVVDADDTDRVEAFVTALASHIDPDWPDGLGWIMSRCLMDRGDVRGSVELVERLAADHECDFAPLLVDAAGIASDRGDAKAALRLLTRAGLDESRLYDDHDDDPFALGREPDEQGMELLAEVIAYARAPKAPVGRNDRCPCGSGRKYKACHLGKEQHALEDRSPWLHDKAMRYVRTTCPEILTELADELAEGDYRTSRQLVSSPFVADLALHEHGLFEEFLTTRGWQLPDDEVLLAQTWLLTDRAVFELLRDPAGELHLRNVASGETIIVTNVHSSDATRPGMYLAGRPVPVGDTHRSFSGFFPVAPQVVNPLVDAIARNDVDEMMTLLAATFRPPTLRNTSGEDLAFHTIRWHVDDPGALREALASAGFTRDDEDHDRWTLVEDTPGMRRAIIATLRLDGTTLVSETNSDERAAAVKDLVADHVSSVHLLDDSRREFDELDLTDADHEPGAFDPNAPEIRAFLDEMIQGKEIEWLDEQIPALSGRTPREAVGDPVGREEVRRLLATFPEPPPGEVAGFSASRLRAHLGLDD